MIRVVIADDHQMFREMLRLALHRNGDLEVAGEAADGQELRTVVDRVRPDVVLLDYKMPHVPSFAGLIQKMRGNHPDVRVVVLSGFSSREVALSAARGGASGYVLKTTRLAAVADAVRVVARGGAWIDPQLDRQVFEVFQREANRPQANGVGETRLRPSRAANARSWPASRKAAATRTSPGSSASASARSKPT